MSDNENKKKTFWAFLTEFEIEIPRIQREYAQGREGEEYLRERFLDKIKKALDGEELTLDFVYGTKDNGKIQPVDGQQRLTTLWLLHWYIALRAGKLEEACGTLKRFSYETRLTSKEFCAKLCDPKNFDSHYGDNISDFIENQAWFKSEWKYDPTILSMLRMLGGSRDKVEMKDSIEKVFGTKDEYSKYWSDLTSANSSIVFYYQPLEEFGLSDGIYVKMNARGKPLSHFENFKADLVGYIHEQAKEDDSWGKLLHPKNGIPYKLDMKWTDLFWKNKSENNTIDEIYFVFLNRFFLNYKIKEIKVGDIGYLAPDSKLYVEVEDENAAEIKYNGLDKYKWKGKIDIGLFKDLQTILDNYCEFEKEIKKDEQIFKCPWEDDFFEFIPFYSEPQVIQDISWEETIVFYAICKYFKEGKADEESLKRWMRFAWNMTYSFHERGIGVSEVQNIIKRIDKIKNSHDIYNELVQLKDDGKDDIPDRQFKEECAKAKKIFNKEVKKLREYSGNSLKEDGSKYKTWEEIIIASEKYAFFQGTIRFLFQDEKGNASNKGWQYFDTKWKNVQKYFKKENLKTNDICLNEKFYNNAKLLKALISRFDVRHYDSLCDEDNIFNCIAKTWRWYLLHSNFCDPVYHLLCGETSVKKHSKPKDFESEDFYKKNALYLLSNTDLLDNIVKNFRYTDIPLKSKKNKYKRNCIAIKEEKRVYSKEAYTIFLDAIKRDRFFIKGEKEVVKISYSCPDYCPYDSKDADKFLFGSDIYFKYKRNNYVWWRDNKIYLQKAKNDNESVLNPETKEDYFFPKEKNKNANDFSSRKILEGLDDLLKRAKREKAKI